MTIKKGSLADRYEQLLSVVADNPAWVAFSGGVDSTLTLKAVSEANSPPAMALFADSPLQSEFDRDNVKRLADQLRFQLMVVSVDPLARMDFSTNADNRCYLCKKSIFGQFKELLPSEFVLMDGTNSDDLVADRPGYQAVVELGVLSPLAMAGLSKHEVRELSRWLKLPNWNRPSSSCLATRIPRGVAITKESLCHIEKCEGLVRRHGFGHIRGRLVAGNPGDLVIELAREEMDRADFAQQQERICEDLKYVVAGQVLFSCRDGVYISKTKPLFRLSDGAFIG